ncbi:helix-turn-helix transcriptional regulator [Rouxiella badensis]|uniref:helix-turn-helix transcriptional regulator n=1 Tax=Rouxiella badensis TaxID=1646377 RepID=UPI003C34B779
MSIVTNSIYNNDIINEAVEYFLKIKFSTYTEMKFTYAVMNKRNPSDFFAISNYPDEWTSIYKSNDYQYIDPVVITSLNTILPFPWNDNIMINANLKLSKVFSIGKKYEIINGYTFVLHDNLNNLATLSILIDKENEIIIKEDIERDKDKLQMLLILAHDKLTTLYRDINAVTLKNNKKNEELFSKRENDVLYWSSMGKTYKEITLILGIKLTTVKFHMGNAVKKLGVINAKQAIRLSTEMKLIKPA